MNIAIYARVGCQKQQEFGKIPEAQIQHIESWAKLYGHVIVKRYWDCGTSASDYGRPGFQRLICDAQLREHPFDAIAVTDISRLFREPGATVLYLRLLQHFKVTIISLANLSNAV